MKPELIKSIIDGVVQLGSWLVLALGIGKVMEVFFKEKSIGKSALEKLNNEHAAIKKEFEDLKKEHTELSEDIASIQMKYERLFETIISKFPFKQ